MGPVLLCLVVLWVVFGAQILGQQLGWALTERLGLVPRSIAQAHGILTAHLLHGSLDHIIANSIALATTGLACRWALPNLLAAACLSSAVGAGILAWIVASTGSLHLGASGIAFGLVAFLIVAALVRGEWRVMLMGLLIALIYGGSWILLLPGEATSSQRISWEMHLGGAIGGAACAWATRRIERTPPPAGER